MNPRARNRQTVADPILIIDPVAAALEEARRSQVNACAWRIIAERETSLRKIRLARFWSAFHAKLARTAMGVNE